MSKENWVEVLNDINAKDWSDWTTFIISIVTSILLLITVVYTAKAAKAAKDAVDTSLEIYTDDKKEKELMLRPIFEIRNAGFGADTNFDLANVNIQHPISITSFGLSTGKNKIKTEKVSHDVVKMKLEKFEMKDQQTLLITLNYTALNHRFYKTTLKVRRDNGTIFIDQINTQMLEE